MYYVLVLSQHVSERGDVVQGTAVVWSGRHSLAVRRQVTQEGEGRHYGNALVHMYASLWNMPLHGRHPRPQQRPFLRQRDQPSEYLIRA